MIWARFRVSHKRYRLYNMYNLHYVLWGYKVEEKLYLGVREQKRLNTTAVVYFNETTRRSILEGCHLQSKGRSKEHCMTYVSQKQHTHAGFLYKYNVCKNRLCGLVVSVEDYKHRGPGFDSRALLRIFLRELGVWNGVHSAS
jgi:hypothetical protein